MLTEVTTHRLEKDIHGITRLPLGDVTVIFKYDLLSVNRYTQCAAVVAKTSPSSAPADEGEVLATAAACYRSSSGEIALTEHLSWCFNIGLGNWCHQAKSQYLRQWRTRSMLSYVVTRSWWVNVGLRYLWCTSNGDILQFCTKSLAAMYRLDKKDMSVACAKLQYLQCSCPGVTVLLIHWICHSIARIHQYIVGIYDSCQVLFWIYSFLTIAHNWHG